MSARLNRPIKRANALIGARASRATWPYAAAIIGVTFLLYLPSLRCGFILYDDDKYVTDNAEVQQGLSLATIRWAFTTTHFANWLPITWLSHLTDVSIFGLNPAGHHATSAALHAVNAGLVFLLFHRMTGCRGPSLATAALFAVHPLRVESAVWIAERKDVLAGTFFLLTLLAYVSYVRKPKPLTYGLAVAAYALGLMSKTMLVTLPMLLVVLDGWPLRRFASAKRGLLIAEKIPFFVLAGIACVWTIMLQRSGGALEQNDALTLTQRGANAIVSVPRYLAKAFWPSELAVFYPHPGTWPAGIVIASASLLAGLTIGAWILRKRMPYVLVGWLWFLGMLAPVSGILQAGLQAMADRYFYLPGIGLTAALVWAGAHELQRRRATKAVQAATVAAVAIPLAIVTLRQQSFWIDTLTLFSHAADVTERNWIAQAYLGRTLADRNRVHEARAHYALAAELNPGNWEPWYNWANLELRQRQFADASMKYRRAIEDRPDFAEAYNNLGIALASMNDLAGAERSFAAAVQLRPAWHEALANHGISLAKLGRVDEARQSLEESLRRAPGNERAARALSQLPPGGS